MLLTNVKAPGPLVKKTNGGHFNLKNGGHFNFFFIFL